MSALLRLLKPKPKREEKPWTPRVYYVELESPVTIEYEGRSYECRDVRETASGILCLQYDGTAVLLPQQVQRGTKLQLV